MADIVNLAFAMKSIRRTADVAFAEDQIIAVLTSFRQQIEDGDPQLWTPKVLIQDAELDDMACWLVLQHVLSRQGSRSSQLEVYLQLPSLEANDSRAGALNAVQDRYKASC